MGDGGKVKSRLAEAALERRANKARRKDLEDQTRIYSHVDQKHWERKYKFFSGRHMERCYRLFTRARHDPFNKDPSWGKSIIQRVAEACKLRQVAPEALFNGIDISSDGMLNRPEMKRVVVSMLPVLSDEELTAIFDTIDTDQSGQVNVKEFCDIIHQGRDFKVDNETATRWRNPIHRIKRIPPSQIEGWDHLEGPAKFRQAEKLCDLMQSEIQERLGDTLALSARGKNLKMPIRPKYQYFNGGGEVDRFRRQQFIKDSKQQPEKMTPRITDPGPHLRPGWMYHVERRELTDKLGTRFEFPLRTPPLAATS
jgi:hypothetical protein